MAREKKAKVVVTGRINPDVLNRAKNLVYWTPGLTLSYLIEEGLRRYLAQLEEEYEFPKDEPGTLRTGRPLKIQAPR